MPYILQHDKEPERYKRDICSEIHGISRPFLLLRSKVSADYYQRALMDESRMIRTQMGKHKNQ
jgi:hypothetical protein